jgi:hypothetical protein
MKYRHNAAIAAGIARFLAAPIVIGALAAAAALSAGAPTASAQQLTPAAAPPAATTSASTTDELNQLRANQQLLQQRLDQLEQIAQVGPARPVLPPGTATLAGSFPRSFLIPGTDTSIQISGQIEYDADRWFVGGSNVGYVGAGTSIIGVPGVSSTALNVGGFLPGTATPAASAAAALADSAARARGDAVFQSTPYASRIHFETRTPTAWGEADSVIEIDFLGCSLGGIDCNNTAAGQDGLGLRLRLAYATLGPWAFGQLWTPTFDLAAQPETLQTGGIAGAVGIGRMPQAACTAPVLTPLGPVAVSVSLTQPETSAVTPQGMTLTDNTNLTNTTLAGTAASSTIAAEQSVSGAGLLGTLNAGSNQLVSVNPLKTELPDLNLALKWNQPWGHIQLSGVAIDEIMDDGFFINKQFVGYGGAFTGDVKPNWFGWAKDDITFTAFDGQGIGRYAGGGGSGNYFPYLATNYGSAASVSTTGGAITGLPTGVSASGQGLATGNPCGYGHTGVTQTAACASFVRAQTIPSFGFMGSYQHWWTDTIRSTAAGGMVYEDIPISIVGGEGINGATFNPNKMILTADVNLIWSPVPFVNTGLEYIWGQRTNLYNQKGDQQVVQYSFILRF